MKFILYTLLLCSTLFALSTKDIADIAFKLNLYAGTKATIQWERIFSSKRRMEKYHINELPQAQQKELKHYLFKHAADSEQPIVPGL